MTRPSRAPLLAAVLLAVSTPFAAAGPNAAVEASWTPPGQAAGTDITGAFANFLDVAGPAAASLNVDAGNLNAVADALRDPVAAGLVASHLEASDFDTLRHLTAVLRDDPTNLIAKNQLAGMIDRLGAAHDAAGAEVKGALVKRAEALTALAKDGKTDANALDAYLDQLEAAQTKFAKGFGTPAKVAVAGARAGVLARRLAQAVPPPAAAPSSAGQDVGGSADGGGSSVSPAFDRAGPSVSKNLVRLAKPGGHASPEALADLRGFVGTAIEHGAAHGLSEAEIAQLSELTPMLLDPRLADMIANQLSEHDAAYLKELTGRLKDGSALRGLGGVVADLEDIRQAVLDHESRRNALLAASAVRGVSPAIVARALDRSFAQRRQEAPVPAQGLRLESMEHGDAAARPGNWFTRMGVPQQTFLIAGVFLALAAVSFAAAGQAGPLFAFIFAVAAGTAAIAGVAAAVYQAVTGTKLASTIETDGSEMAATIGAMSGVPGTAPGLSVAAAGLTRPKPALPPAGRLSSYEKLPMPGQGKALYESMAKDVFYKSNPFNALDDASPIGRLLAQRGVKAFTRRMFRTSENVRAWNSGYDFVRYEITLEDGKHAVVDAFKKSASPFDYGMGTADLRPLYHVIYVTEADGRVVRYYYEKGALKDTAALPAEQGLLPALDFLEKSLKSKGLTEITDPNVVLGL